MMANFVSAVLIKTIALSCRLRSSGVIPVISIKRRKRLKKGGFSTIQVEQDIIVWEIRGLAPSMTGVTPASLSSARQ